jgi:hypothetical protein
MSGYGWSYTLPEAVPGGGTVQLPTPGASDPHCKLDEATLAVGANVVPADQFTIALDAPTKSKGKKAKEGEEPEPPETCTLTNGSEVEWPAGAGVYVGVPGATASDVAGAIDANQAAMSAMQGQIDALDARVAALEAASPPADTKSKR